MKISTEVAATELHWIVKVERDEKLFGTVYNFDIALSLQTRMQELLTGKTSNWKLDPGMVGTPVGASGQSFCFGCNEHGKRTLGQANLKVVPPYARLNAQFPPFSPPVELQYNWKTFWMHDTSESFWLKLEAGSCTGPQFFFSIKRVFVVWCVCTSVFGWTLATIDNDVLADVKRQWVTFSVLDWDVDHFHLRRGPQKCKYASLRHANNWEFSLSTLQECSGAKQALFKWCFFALPFLSMPTALVQEKCEVCRRLRWLLSVFASLKSWERFASMQALGERQLVLVLGASKALLVRLRTRPKKNSKWRATFFLPFCSQRPDNVQPFKSCFHCLPDKDFYGSYIVSVRWFLWDIFLCYVYTGTTVLPPKQSKKDLICQYQMLEFRVVCCFLSETMLNKTKATVAFLSEKFKCHCKVTIEGNRNCNGEALRCQKSRFLGRRWPWRKRRKLFKTNQLLGLTPPKQSMGLDTNCGCVLSENCDRRRSLKDNYEQMGCKFSQDWKS